MVAIRIFNVVSRSLQGLYAATVVFFVSIYYAPIESCRYDLYVWLVVWGVVQSLITTLSLSLDIIAIRRFRRGDPSIFVNLEKVSVGSLLVISLFNLGWVCYGICPVFIWRTCADPSNTSLEFFGYVSWCITVITNVIPLIFIIVLSILYFTCADATEDEDEENAGVPEETMKKVKVIKWKEANIRRSKQTPKDDKESTKDARLTSSASCTTFPEHIGSTIEITEVSPPPPKEETKEALPIGIRSVHSQESRASQLIDTKGLGIEIRSMPSQESRDSRMSRIGKKSVSYVSIGATLLTPPVSDMLFGSEDKKPVGREASNSGEDDNMCAICYVEYEDEDDVAMLPCDERHMFHLECVSNWFQRSRICPTCRADVVVLLSDGPTTPSPEVMEEGGASAQETTEATG